MRYYCHKVVMIMPRKYNYDWRALSQEQQDSGMNMTQFCLLKKIPYPTFKRNMMKLQSLNESFKFIPIERSKEDTLHVIVNGYSLSIDKRIDDASLSRILKALG